MPSPPSPARRSRSARPKVNARGEPSAGLGVLRIARGGPGEILRETRREKRRESDGETTPAFPADETCHEGPDDEGASFGSTWRPAACLRPAGPNHLVRSRRLASVREPDAPRRRGLSREDVGACGRTMNASRSGRRVAGPRRTGCRLPGYPGRNRRLDTRAGAGAPWRLPPRSAGRRRGAPRARVSTGGTGPRDDPGSGRGRVRRCGSRRLDWRPRGQARHPSSGCASASPPRRR